MSVLHLELFPRPAAVWSGTQKAHEQVKIPETDLEHHPALLPYLKENPLIYSGIPLQCAYKDGKWVGSENML